jgi:hypothetical protein
MGSTITVNEEMFHAAGYVLRGVKRENFPGEV